MTTGVTVGGGGRMNAMMGILAPRLTDRYMERHTFKDQMTDIPVTAERGDNLYANSLIAIDTAGRALTPCVTYADSRSAASSGDGAAVRSLVE